MTVLEAPLPCSPGMSKCHAKCLHRAMVREYRDWRAQWEADCEAFSRGYDTEAAEYAEQHPPPTFKQWLQQAGYGSAGLTVAHETEEGAA